MATFEECCEEVRDRLTTLANLLTAVSAAQIALQNDVQNLFDQQQILGAVLQPVITFARDSTALDLWMNDQFINKAGIQVALLTGLEIALREGGVGTRQTHVAIQVDALGKWLLDALKSAIDQMPGSVSVDPEEPGPIPSGPINIGILVYDESKLQIGDQIFQSGQGLDGGSDKQTGGSAAYGPAIAATGRGLSGIISSFGVGLAEGLAKGLKKGEIIPGAEAKPEEDPIWAIMRRSIFGTAEQPPLTQEELADIVAGSTTIVETPPAEEGTPPETPPAPEGTP